MKAAVLEEFGKPLVIKEVELPQLLDDEVTIEVKACGLCLTDIHIQEGRVPTVTLPLIPGHEFSGVVIAKGSKVNQVQIGWRVTVFVDVVCGDCRYCALGETSRCMSMKRIGFERSGGMAEYVNIPAKNVQRISEEVSFEKAAVIPDAVASMYRGLKTMGKVGVGTELAIVGVGGLGIQGVKIAKLMGAHITCVDIDDRKLVRAKEFGAKRTINPNNENLIDAANELDGGFDVVIDNVGRSDSFLKSVSACCPGGRVIAMGYVENELSIPAYDVVIREKKVMGSRSISRTEFKEVVEWVNRGDLDPDIGEIVPIDEINTAYEKLKRGEYLTRTVLLTTFKN